MSQPGLYTPPDYTPPEEIRSVWEGRERRSAAPVRQLSRSLNRLCLEAADAYEIAAHLEALGYSDSRRLRAYGVEDHFVLTETMYWLTPRRRSPFQPVRQRPRSSNLRTAVMVLTLLVTIGISVITSVQAWAPVIFLLVWSQVGSALLARAEEELDEAHRQPVLTVLASAGFVGLAGLWSLMPYGPEAAIVAVLWLGVTGFIWNRQAWLAALLPVVALSLLVAHYRLGLSLPLMLLLLTLMSSSLLYLLLLTTRRPDWRWIASQRREMLPYLLYGIGQGCLLVALLGDSQAAASVIPGTALFIGSMLIFEYQLLQLQRRLSGHLWLETSQQQYRSRAWRSLLAYTGIFLMPFLPVLAIWVRHGPQPWFHYWCGFALLGLILGLALVFLSLGDAGTPAVIFILAGPLALMSSFFLIGSLVALTQLYFLLRRAGKVSKYGIHLL
jgi:hypothetical protein